MTYNVFSGTLNPTQSINHVGYLPSVLWRGRKGIRPVKNLSGEVLTLLSVWSEVQIICIWSSYCHPIISCSSKIHNCLPFWCQLTHCLEGKGENYQVCSVQYCVQQLCTVQCTHIWTDLTGLWIGFCLTGPMSLLRFIFVYVRKCMYFLYDCILHECVVIVTWWGGPGGIQAYP